MSDLISSPSWDRMEFTYQSADSGEDVSLPLKLLILGDFSGQFQKDFDDATQIDTRSFNQVLAAMDVEVSFELAVDLDNNRVTYIDIDVSIARISDFEPESLLMSVDYLYQHVALIKKLKLCLNQATLNNVVLDEKEQALLAHCGIDYAVSSFDELPFILFDINEHLHEILSQVIQNEQFQKLESIWRNLYRLVFSEELAESCVIEILDISKASLEEDFEANREIQDTVLYDAVYLKEYAQYGGQPYSAIIADYYFSAGSQDLQLLKNIAKVCRLAHAPFIAGASPKFFNEEDFSQLEIISDIPELMSSPRYIKWRSFQKTLDSAYIGLALPRVKLREAYKLGAGEIDAIPYSESVAENVNQNLLGNASFAFAKCLINSFAKYAVCTDLTGHVGGSVDMYHSTDTSKQLFPNYMIEAMISERQLMDLANVGFLTLAYNKAQQNLFFTSSASVRWGNFSAHKSLDPSENFSSQVEAQLPYIFIVSRIVHYLKVVQRESIGVQKSLIQVQTELNKWLKRYVSDVENPAEAIRARKPLKKAEVVLSAPDINGEQSLDLTIVPHLRFMGKDFSLSLTMNVD
ncbi:type VI secretion system contractile sheath large subunit [Psychrosphaera sp. B3R10]|uniref:type VI secretion system contractile sheath large subunit n=1 Tax=unclassified Psychrosphaera TaxID=2641570 RepID=UPI001C0A4089|nr:MULTISPECIES: type VI secretion system contractile sheath large subunit [unclassified Psychrosphaera]MBU2880496.1 type VI secretion system contractile sheath large subunit [Psychrosphaera sp. I2R16]MBU2987911.1 type VI secretion system contractile sheath large subunit [Psychrosphaera sp. B3R10]